MATDKGGIYQRGGFWLDLARGAGGVPVSPKFYICWYDPERGRQRRKTTGTADVRLACKALDEHYLANLKPTEHDRAAYSVSIAMVDYFIEHASKLPSADAIKARLKLMQRFLDVEVGARRLRDPIMPADIDDTVINRFRDWALAQPIVARRKNERGEWVDGTARPRSAATVEESVIALKACLRYAYNARRSAEPPPIKHKTRSQVTQPSRRRISIATMGEMLDYTMRGGGNYAGHSSLLLPLRRYLVAALCTMARPDAILDMSVKEHREQWFPDDRRFALNPAGRPQTKKRRPVIPVNDVLDSWLKVTDEWFVCREIVTLDGVSLSEWKKTHRKQADRELRPTESVKQQRVASIRSAWDTMRKELKLPNAWGPKLLRHSMATEVRKRNANPWELSGFLGHHVAGTSETYAIFDPAYLGTVHSAISDILADLGRQAGRALHPNITQVSDNVTVLRA